MTYHYHGIDVEESILTKSLPNWGTWALPNLFFITKFEIFLVYQETQQNAMIIWAIMGH